ncbi:MAG: OmpA family protein [Vicingaceae bacterium]|nr:OmpA family protein [Vicingaceae bacterium]
MKKIKLLIALSCLTGITLKAQNIEAIKFNADPENMGEMVNSEYSDLSPHITPDGKTLFISRYPSNNNDKNNIWVSYLKADGTWTKSANIGTPLNVPGSATSVQSITPDGNTVLLSNIYQYFDGSVAGGGCSISSRQRGGWAFPRHQEIDKYENRAKTVNYCLANSGRYLIMAVEKKKGHGLKDLWVSFPDGSNKWGRPINLGEVVNTEGEEFAPFLAADDKTLYFASGGHEGFGGVDIWMTKRLDETWTNWSKPINMGDKINTKGFDSYFSIDAGGKYAYFASDKSGFGKSDIFRIKLPEEAKPDPVVLVYGKVLDKKTGKPIKADILYEYLPSGVKAGQASTSPEDGVYKIVLPFGKNYGFMATSDKYYAITENLDLSNLKEYQEIEKNLYLAPIEKEQAIRLNNIFFEFGKATLKEESFPELKRLIKLLNDNPSITIELSGHTDNVGSDADNLTLSQNRADAVVEYLTQNGIKANRLTAKGYGETKPVATNDTEEGKQLNRRVSFTVKNM